MSATAENWGQQVADELENGDTNDASDFDMDAGDTNPDDLQGNIYVDKPGKYHFEIEEAKLEPSAYRNNDMTKPTFPHVNLRLRVLASAEGQSPAESVLYQELAVKGKGGQPWEEKHLFIRERTFAFLYNVGILEKRDDKLIDPETGTTKLNVLTFADRLKGKQFIGRVTKNENNGYVSYEVRGENVFRVDDPKVADVVKNPEALKLIGMGHVQCGPAANAAAGGGKPRKPAKPTGDAPQANASGGGGGAENAPAVTTSNHDELPDI